MNLTPILSYPRNLTPIHTHPLNQWWFERFCTPSPSVPCYLLQSSALLVYTIDPVLFHTISLLPTFLSEYVHYIHVSLSSLYTHFLFFVMYLFLLSLLCFHFESSPSATSLEGVDGLKPNRPSFYTHDGEPVKVLAG